MVPDLSDLNYDYNEAGVFITVIIIFKNTIIKLNIVVQQGSNPSFLI